MTEENKDSKVLPTPPLFTFDPRTGMPPRGMIQEIGFPVASLVYNHQNAGAVYRYMERQMKTVISGPAANLFMAQHTNEHLSARLCRHEQSKNLNSDKYLVAMDGEEHYQLRKVQKRGYARSVLDSRYAELVEIVQRRTSQWQPGQIISVKQFMQEVVIEQLGTTMLNYPTPEHWQDICFFIDTMLVLSFASVNLGEKRMAAYQKSQSRIMALADEIIAAHREQPPGGHRPDLVDDLLAAVDEDNDLLNEQDLRISVLTPYIAGTPPVSHTCTFLLHALLDHPYILKEVVDEIDAVFTGERPVPALLRKMDRLRYSVMEALRIYPFAPILQMVVVEPFEFDGHLIESGTNLVIGTAVSHYLPESFPEPLEFAPDRYRPERSEHRQPGAYAPYGAGPHICLGAGFAEVQIMLTMAALLSSIQLEIEPGSRKPAMLTPGRDNFTARVVKQRQ